MENGKWKISGNNTKDGFGNQPNPTLSNVSKPHNLKNAKCAGVACLVQMVCSNYFKRRQAPQPKKRKVRREFCAKRESGPAAATGCFVQMIGRYTSRRQ